MDSVSNREDDVGFVWDKESMVFSEDGGSHLDTSGSEGLSSVWSDGGFNRRYYQIILTNAS
jgi:hypothetical protein